MVISPLKFSRCNQELQSSEPQLGPASGVGQHMLHRLAVTRSSAAVEASKEKLCKSAVARSGVALEAMNESILDKCWRCHGNGHPFTEPEQCE